MPFHPKFRKTTHQQNKDERNFSEEKQDAAADSKTIFSNLDEKFSLTGILEDTSQFEDSKNSAG